MTEVVEWEDVTVAVPGSVPVDALPGRRAEGWPEGVTTERPVAPAVSRAEVEAETPDLFHRGGAFVLDIPDTPPAVWGDGEHVIWAEGEALMIAAPQGVGKTTLAIQLVRARLGLADQVLGHTVRPGDGRVLYLAMDRPAQFQRAARRIFRPQDRALLDERLAIWKGPPPYDMAQRRDILAVMAQKAKADTVVVDSIKDAALGIAEDAVGAGYNRARQQALTEGIQVLELHHTIKRGANGSAPDDLAGVYGSTWLTSGAGSVVSLWGEAGDPVVTWRHLKQPSQEVGPFRVVHDHEHGTSTVEVNVDLVALVRRTGVQGLTAMEYAVALFERPNPSRAQKEKARRLLEKKVNAGHLSRTGGETGGSPARYYLALSEVHEGVHAA
ncbi:AAA family ATPase [Verrucosispora sp. WMMD1129]|uniref:AAA family ATPase n=1 Tax=Verrucosispora sp. WMMD1129 TaxID=3016093 RepID=UPI00249CEA5A|nr:AAA family ATPase [Verrucosispora sp. WMMD1129]WFE44277.1 AAA family ATPase [Verrucosispora sp. WMMD1129]